MKARALTSAGVGLMLALSQASVTPLRVRVMDRTGAPFSDVLVIAKSLEGKGELFRALTDATGAVPERGLAPGLYRVIATCPYGICETQVREVLVSAAPVELELRVDVSPTRGYGDFAIVGPSNQVKVRIVDRENKPAACAKVLVRDSHAEFEQWYRTSSNGEADVEPLGAVVTFVVLYKGTLTEESFSSTSIQRLRSEGVQLVITLK